MFSFELFDQTVPSLRVLELFKTRYWVTRPKKSVYRSRFSEKDLAKPFFQNFLNLSRHDLVAKFAKVSEWNREGSERKAEESFREPVIKPSSD